MPIESVRALAVVTLMLACSACGATPRAQTPPTAEPPDPSAYRTCEGEGSCGARAECIEGLCVPGCDGATACREASACWEGECREACDAAHPCGLGYRCTAEGSCAYDPCGSIALYPLSLRSATLPVLVHYRDPVEAEAAREALAATEEAWRIETEQMGWEPPLSDEGRCGPDGALDVFVWRTYRGCVSDVVGEVEATPHDDRANYLIVDPWGPYGGTHLRATVAHELSHAMQAVHDWNEAAIAFEMSAQYVESLFAPEEPTWVEYFGDYQRRADWSFDRDDGYETYYMYGSALYLHFLRERVFEPGPARERFLAEVWRGCRSVAGNNEPDLFDALDSVLRARAGISFEESLIRFTRARYYTGSRSDGHFSFGARMRDDWGVPVQEMGGARFAPAEGPQLLGAHYVRVRGERRVSLTLSGDAAVRFVVQALPGITPGSDGELLSADATGPLEVAMTAQGERVLAILALPRDEASWDPDARTDARYAYTLERR